MPFLFLLIYSGITAASPFPVEDAFAIRRLAWDNRPTLSPNGELLAYVVQLPVKKTAGARRYLPTGMPVGALSAQLYVMDISTGKSEALCAAPRACLRPAWSPDGKELAYYGDSVERPASLQLWIYDAKTKKKRALPGTLVKASLWHGDEPIWNRDGRSLYFPVPPLGARSVAGSGTGKDGGPEVYRAGPGFSSERAPAAKANDAFFRLENLAGLATIDSRTGKKRVLDSSSETVDPSVYRVSSTGKWISMLSIFRSPDQSSDRSLRDLAVISARGGKVHWIAKGLPVSEMDYHLLNYRWHPSRDELYYLKGGRLWMVDFSSGSPTTEKAIRGSQLVDVAEDPLLFDRDGKAVIVGLAPLDRNDYRGPLPTAIAWVPLDEPQAEMRTFVIHPSEQFRRLVPSGDKTAWQDEDSGLVIQVTDLEGNLQRLYRLDPKNGKREMLYEGRGRFSHFVGTQSLGNRLIAVYEDGVTPPSVFTLGPRLERKLVASIDPRLAGIRLAEPRLVTTEIKLPDGTKAKAKAAVLLPEATEGAGPPPAVVIGYPGGEESRFMNFFAGGEPTAAGPCLLYTSRGYAVVLIDTPIGPEGKAGNPLREIHDAVAPQIEHLASLKLIDATRVAFLGQSYGGYMATGLATRTKLFAAVIATSGVYDLPSHYGILGEAGVAPGITWSETGQGRMGGTLWENRERYLENSPYFQADRITTPVLLIHGTLDRSVEEAKRMFVALRRLERTAELALYPDEDHAIVEWATPHAVDAINRIVKFLDKFVKGEST